MRSHRIYPHHRLLIVFLCCLGLWGCGKSSSPKIEANSTSAQSDIEKRIQEEAAKIATERERLADLQQEQREKVAADLAARTDSRAARRETNLENAAAEQARREGITDEVKTFIDTVLVERSQLNDIQILRMNGQAVKPGSVLASPAGYSVTYLKEDGDFFWFTYDEDAFSLTLKKTSGGLSVAQAKSKQPLAEGFQVDQKLPNASASMPSTSLAGSRGLLILKATYGAEQVQRDVKDIVKSKIQSGHLSFRADSGELGGDPIFGKSKTFYIKYSTGGRVVERSYGEGGSVSLP